MSVGSSYQVQPCVLVRIKLSCSYMSKRHFIMHITLNTLVFEADRVMLKTVYKNY